MLKYSCHNYKCPRVEDTKKKKRVCERELAAKIQMWTVTDRAREQGRGPTAGRE